MQPRRMPAEAAVDQQREPAARPECPGRSAWNPARSDDKLLSLLADEGLTDEVQIILREAGWRSEPARDRLGELFTDLSELEVDDVKRDNLDQGELAASAFTTIFIVTGLFGIAAGLLLDLPHLRPAGGGTQTGDGYDPRRRRPTAPPGPDVCL